MLFPRRSGGFSIHVFGAVLAIGVSLVAQGLSYAPLPTAPSAASRFVWDGVRSVLIAVESDPEPRTWSWDGGSWSVVLGGTTPLLHRAATVFDPFRGRVMVVAPNAIYEFDGVIWTATSAAGGLPFVAFDVHRRRLVTTDGGVVREWDGSTWATIAVTGGPGLRQGCAFAYDPVSQRCLLYGGVGPTSGADFWAWDGSTWNLVTANSPAGPRDGAVLSHDPSLGRMVLYGGDGGATTWAFANGSWRALATSANPGPRSDATMAWDGSGLVLHGGSGSRGGELWRLMGSTWSELTGGRPDGRYFATIGWDSARGHAVLFGGQNRPSSPSYLFDDTWTFDGRWRKAAPTATPSSVSYPIAPLVWSTAENMLMLWQDSGRTWNWTGSDWVDRAPLNSPPSRCGAMLATDPLGGVMLFGGVGCSQQLFYNDHWLWNGVDWQQVTPGGVPGPRASALAVHDPVRNEVVMAGGHDGATEFLETWLWNGSVWTAAAPAPFGQAFAHHSIAFRPRTATVVVSHLEHHEWDGANWSTLGLIPWTRRDARLVTDTSAGILRAYPWGTGAAGGLATLAEAHAGATRYGVPCAVGPAPALAALGRPVPGSPTFRIACTTFATSAPTFLAVGLTATSQPLGSSCRLLVSNVLDVRPVVSSVGGYAEIGLPVPSNPALRGVNLHAQAAVIDPLRSLSHGVTISRGIRVSIGY